MTSIKQPKGLYYLFFTELWERFGFYTLQTILILYMTKGLLMSDNKAYLLYGAFSAMIYFTPVIGGYLADRYLGFQSAIILGGVLLSLGYLIVAIPNEFLFFFGLSTLIVANGFFKPNVSSILGKIYHEDDPRRDGGFTLFYMGINIGALIPPIFTGALVAAYGWHAGFLLAAAGMIVGLIVFIVGRPKFKGCGTVPQLSPLRSNKRNIFIVLLTIGIVASVALFHMLLLFPEESDLILGIATFFIVLFVIYFLFKEKLAQRNKMIACLILILISLGFWALYNQTYTSLMLFADRNMSKQFLGFTIDAEFTQFFNPFFIVILSPILSRIWIYLERKKSHPSTPTKFSLGILMMSLGFFLLGIAGKYFGYNGETSPWWLSTSYLLQTIGELLISPIGLAMITTLSPKHLVGMMMGVWFLTQSAAFAIGGGLATLSSVPEEMSATLALGIYSKAFLIYGTISLVLAVISFFLVPFLKRLIQPKNRPLV